MLSHVRWRQALCEAGFSTGGVAPPRIPAADAEALGRWLAAGFQAEMGWIERSATLRSDPASFLPGARCLLVVGLDTWAPPAGLAGGGRIARYARGRDYHRFMARRLRELRRILGLGLARPALDIHPILERALAAQAGLGWRGRQSQLVSPLFGPWLLLGELFTESLLEPAPPAEAQAGCASCRACQAACPTGAIVAPGVVDSRRCLSFWTIEARTLQPPELRAAQGEWLFGCDLCLEACPIRRAPAPAPDPDLQPTLPELSLAELLDLTPLAFEERIRATPLRRAGLAGLRRNAAIVAANLGRADLAGSLTGLLAAARPDLRAAGAWALGRLRLQRADLERALKVEEDPMVEREIATALAAVCP